MLSIYLSFYVPDININIEIMEQYKEFELSSEWMVLLEATESLSEQFPGSDGVVANTSQVFFL